MDICIKVELDLEIDGIQISTAWLICEYEVDSLKIIKA